MKKALIIIICLAIAVSIGGGIWQLYIRNESKKHNLITLDTSLLPTPVDGPKEETDIQLSDFKMHYAVYGNGEKPLILIHGNGSNHKRLEEAALYFANEYTVYAPDSRCHGESEDPGEISYELMAKDIAEFVEALGLEKPYVLGHSDGGIIALTIAKNYPDLLGGFVSCGANTNPSTFKPYFTLAVKVNNFFKHDKLNDMMLTLPNFTDEDYAKIKALAYIVAGEYDIMWLSDTVHIHECIEGSKIAITKGENHSSYVTGNGKKAYVLAKGFFDELNVGEES